MSKLVDYYSKVANVSKNSSAYVGTACESFISSPQSTPHFYDNGASFHTTNDIEDLSTYLQLPRPISMGGIGSGVSLTHVDTSKIVPPLMQQLSLLVYLKFSVKVVPITQKGLINWS